jgi:hypothetical protein
MYTPTSEEPQIMYLIIRDVSEYSTIQIVFDTIDVQIIFTYSNSR